jgi:hypothetical protein
MAPAGTCDESDVTKAMRNLLTFIGLIAAAATALLVLPSAAGADSQPVSGVVQSTLGISVSGPVVLTGFAPGQTATGSGSVTVTSTGPWVLRLQDLAGTNPGHMLRTAGTGGATALAHALDWAASPTLGGTGGSGSLSGTATVAASGTLSDLVVMNYSQPIGATEQLTTGSVYGLTVTITVSPT